MNRRLGWLAVVVTTLLASSPGLAQHQRPRPGYPPKPPNPANPPDTASPMQVSDWQPRSGPPGTQVTIQGSGFTAQTQILFGGREVRGARKSRTSLTFAVPRPWGDGSITLRHPRLPEPVAVGVFEVIADPEVASLSPKSGGPGTRVEVKGSGFRTGDQVLMNGRPMVITSLAADHIVVVIEPDASDDYLTVSRPGGPQSRSRDKFRVERPAPVITGMLPTRGPAGTKVRISGQHFTKDTKAFYGPLPASVADAAATWIDVTIPDRARESDLLSVRNQWGRAETAYPFQLERPAIVSRFAPTYGAPGQRVELYGDSFLAGDRVTLNGLPVMIVQQEETQITVEIPRGATTGAFAVHRGGDTWPVDRQFEVVYPPRATHFAPRGGPVGTKVTITGEQFTPDTQVFLDRHRLRIVNRTENSLLVVIPPGASGHPFTIRTRGGEVVTARPFDLYTYSTVSRIAPTSGPAGTQVVIYGRNFSGADRFWCEGVELPVLEWKPDQVSVTVPESAQSGLISWQSHDRKQQTRWTFQVVMPPRVVSIEPRRGPAGSQVVITGEHFTNRTVALWGGRWLTVTHRALPTQLTVQLPRNITGQEHIEVDDGGLRARAPEPFVVHTPPTIERYSPQWATPGAEITLEGSHYSDATRVRWGNVPVPVLRWQENKLTVRLPGDLKPGRDYFWVEDGPMKERARHPFEVGGLPTIASFQPKTAQPRQKIQIDGTHFRSGVQVFFGTQECQVANVLGNGRRMFVTLPEKAEGKEHLWVQIGEHRAKSEEPLEIQPRPGTRPPVGPGPRRPY
jgi:hypothetical protein